MHDGSKIEDLIFCESLNRTISKRYLPMFEEFYLKLDLEIQIIDSVYTDGAPAMLGNVSFCFGKSG